MLGGAGVFGQNRSSGLCIEGEHDALLLFEGLRQTAAKSKRL